jgi:antitoxin component of RelBE/YafQ-DinJ toxin-antitoxin module
MAIKDKALSPIRIESETRRQVKIKSAETGIPIATAIRAFLRAWASGDKRAIAIVEEAKKK